MIIHCTKKLLDYGKFAVQQVSDLEYDPFFRWHANLFIIHRKKCIILMNDRTRYSMVLFGVKKETMESFDQVFRDALIRNWRFEGIEEHSIRDYLMNGGEISYSQTYNRSILGSINDMIGMMEALIEDYLPTEETNILQLNYKNNRIPISVLQELYAIRSLKTALNQ